MPQLENGKFLAIVKLYMYALCLSPFLALIGSCLQYLSSMYSPAKAIEPLFVSVSPFIDTYGTNKMYYEGLNKRGVPLTVDG